MLAVVVNETFGFEILCGRVLEGFGRAGAMSMGSNILDFVVLGE